MGEWSLPGRGSRRLEEYMTVHIKLYGEKAELFSEIKQELTEEFGYEPTNPEVVGVLMGNYSSPKKPVR